ncbi:MAG: ABC transporter permease [Chloroflexi bacterium]|jgi:ribose transport system permease protein|uniref:Autoinducer 2 import system permease protein LsrD n=1 Tax=Candidatus Thermofonsia Clade 3 bacterium TaxID=2364212 RepID=A0A2M8QG89_9CHLR|nr:ABC transporter permease [Candidatus Roseilinea sp. NK_OTU-006]PJF48835.1 MAG: sugar ABC transporter permease [Candidatus Thermofonsia Clade 3 bacterium]RMG64437.1 MAG: ABC transporter permease [Chloroflexota bacterium]
MATTTSDAQLSTRERSLRVRLIPYIDRFGILFLVLLMVLIGAITQPGIFLTWRNLSNLPGQNAANAVLAIGMFVVILTAGIDLSVGSVLALAMMTTAVLARDGFPPALLVPLPILIGMGVGLVNGFGLTKMRLPHPFIVTLGTLNIARGLANLVSGGVPVSGLPEVVRFWGAGNIALGNVQLPVSLIIVAVLYVGFLVFLQYTRTGRHIYAIGGNPQAARVSGINVDRTLMLVYILCGAMAGLAGLLVAGRTNSGFPNAGIGAELDAISAVIIGGASFFGGRGSVLGVLAGVLVIGLMRNILNLNNVQVFWQQVLIGVVIIFAVFLDVLRRRAGSASE